MVQDEPSEHDDVTAHSPADDSGPTTVESETIARLASPTDLLSWYGSGWSSGRV